MRDINLILGAGPAGLGAAYALRQKGMDSIILEKEESYGGLCANFIFNGFRFDRFVHFSFTTNEFVSAMFCHAVNENYYRHIPNPYNIYKGKWIKHPAQNNTFHLDESEKMLIIDSFMHRKPANTELKNYEDWLRVQYGDYFAEHFPMVYTRKYWMNEARDLRTEWIGSRMYQPSVEEVIAGSKTAETPVTYYAKEMHYPKKGGYKAFLRELGEAATIEYGKQVTKINPMEKKIVANEIEYAYNRLISSLPLPEVLNMIDNVPAYVREACTKLECTCGYHVSVALKTTNIPPYLWWYIYDEDILASRVHSPSLKSPDNAPEGCSSLQMEVYCKKDQYTEKDLLDGTVGKLVELGIINNEDILFTHIGFEPYANVIFNEPIYESRKIVRDWLKEQGIETIGRFGEWDYLWSDQSLLSGMLIF